MNKYLIIICAVLGIACATLWGVNGRLKTEKERLAGNQQTLLEKAEYYETEAGKSAASVQRLQLSHSELEDNYSQVCKVADDLRIKLKRMEAATTTQTKTEVEVEATVKDSVVRRDDTLPPLKLQTIEWKDPWVSVTGELAGKNLKLNISSVDTLTQIVWRVPKRFWFIKYGTKAIRQEIVSSNPHTKIVYSEYIELESKCRKRRKK
nr:MAG TPA: hypothetical protein [Caudoviricetes sp.]